MADTTCRIVSLDTFGGPNTIKPFPPTDSSQCERQSITPPGMESLPRTMTMESGVTTLTSVGTLPSTRLQCLIRRIWEFLFQPDAPSNEVVPHYRMLPILCGVVVPFSALLEIPGVTERWYIRTLDNAIVETRANPAILDVGMALSMICGLMANVFLICRFLELRPRMMTLFAIICLSITDLINAVAVTIFGIVHRFDDGFTYGEPFWITLCSTIASSFVLICLVVDLIRTKDFAKRGSGLTRKQRSLVVVVIMLLSWIAFGSLCNKFLLHLDFVSALYFTVVTIETIGFGDIAPKSTGARIFNLIYTVLGVLNLALAVSIARETIIEVFEQSYRRRTHDLAERRKDYHRRRVAQQARTHAIECQLRAAGLPAYVPKRRQTLTNQMELNTNALTEAQLGAAMKEASELTQTQLQTECGVGLPPRHATFTIESNARLAAADHVRTELAVVNQSWDNHEHAYKSYKKFLAREEEKETTAKIFVALSLFVLFWTVGAGIFAKTEGWTFGIALYFCFVTFSTIGYGDFSPKTPAGRAIFVVWALFGVATMTILISVISEAYSIKFHKILANDSVEATVKAMHARAHRDVIHRADTESGGGTQSKNRIWLQDVKNSMESMSQELIHMAREFHGHLHYFNTAAGNGLPPPESLKLLFDDVLELEKVDAEMKRNILYSVEARKVLFIMSYEKRLRSLVNKAESTLAKLGQRSSDIEALDDLLEQVFWRRRVTGVKSEELSPYDRRTVYVHDNGLVSEPDLQKTRGT